MMKDKELKDQLFSKVARVFVILDGGLIPDLRMKLFDMRPEYHCLMTGELEPDVAAAAPYLVRLLPNAPFTEWLLSDFLGNNFGIFAQTKETVIEMRKHFRGLFTVYDEEGDPMLFRFYDPRVFRNILPGCDQDQLKAIFGKVDTYFAETEDGQGLIRYELTDDGLKLTEPS
jgi:hypothetical protein